MPCGTPVARRHLALKDRANHFELGCDLDPMALRVPPR